MDLKTKRIRAILMGLAIIGMLVATSLVMAQADVTYYVTNKYCSSGDAICNIGVSAGIGIVVGGCFTILGYIVGGSIGATIGGLFIGSIVSAL